MNRSLRARFTLGVILLLVFVLGAFSVFEYARHRQVTLNNLALLATHSGRVIEKSLRHEMVERDPLAVQELLDAVGESDEFSLVYILDAAGRVAFAPNGDGVGLQLGADSPDCEPCHALAPASRPDSMIVAAADGQRVFRTMLPIENGPECAECHEAEQQLIGLLLTDIPLAPLEAPLVADLRENLLWWAGMVLGAVLVVNMALSRFVLRPLQAFIDAIAGVGLEPDPAPLPEMQLDELNRLRRAFNAMIDRIETRAAENRALSEALQRQSAQRGELLKRLISAQEEERKRVARELHDDLGPALGGLGLQAEALDRLIARDPDRARAQLRHTRALIGETTERVHELILALRPSALDDLGLASALRNYAERLLRGTGIAFDMDASALTTRLPAEVETALYRTFQEALSNVVRHADARRVRVRLVSGNGAFDGEVVDDGCGFDLHSIPANGDALRGLGLLGMRERVAQCGGKLEIDSRPGHGARIAIQLPITEEGCCG